MICLNESLLVVGRIFWTLLNVQPEFGCATTFAMSPRSMCLEWDCVGIPPTSKDS